MAQTQADKRLPTKAQLPSSRQSQTPAYTCADAIAELTGGDKQVERAALAVADGVQFEVHAAFTRAPSHRRKQRLPGSDQASTRRFLTPKPVAMR